MSNYFITGTDTGVGKTFVTAVLAKLLKLQGNSVGVYKPIESGGRHENGAYISQDATFVKNYANLKQPLAEINTYCFKEAVSPHLAAQLNNQAVDLELILKHYKSLTNKYERVLVEGAGGICVPISGLEVLIADLIKLLRLPVIVVARPNLGTLNHTMLTVKYAQSCGLTVKGLIINYSQHIDTTIVEVNNLEVIERLTGVPVLGVIPYLKSNESISPEKYLDAKSFREAVNNE